MIASSHCRCFTDAYDNKHWKPWGISNPDSERPHQSGGSWLRKLHKTRNMVCRATYTNYVMYPGTAAFQKFSLVQFEATQPWLCKILPRCLPPLNFHSIMRGICRLFCGMYRVRSTLWLLGRNGSISLCITLISLMLWYMHSWMIWICLGESFWWPCWRWMGLHLGSMLVEPFCDASWA